MSSKNNSAPRRGLSRLPSPVLAGLSLGVLFFLHGLFNSFSLSYMGNTSERITQIIFDRFLLHSIAFTASIFLFFLLAGLGAGIGAWFAIRAFSFFWGVDIDRRRQYLVSAAGLLLLYLLLFFRDLILYPQVYMNNFYFTNGLNRWLVDSLTSSLSPGFFSAILYGALVLLLMLAGLYAYRKGYRPRPLPIAGISLALIIAALPPCHCAGGKGDPARPNILVLASDALRPDHLGGYGHANQTSPAIDRLIKNGVSFHRALIEVPRTFPSLVSTLTGQFSATHGIRHMFPGRRELGRKFTAVAGILNGRGYYTAVAGDFAGDIFSRIDLGFQSVDAPFFNFTAMLKQGILDNYTFIYPFITNRFGIWLFPSLRGSASFCPAAFLGERVKAAMENAGDRPFFVFSFFSSTHFPFAAPWPYYRLFTDESYRGPYKYHKQQVVGLDKNRAPVITDADIRQIRGLYDGCVRSFDDTAGDILHYLQKTGRMDNTIIVVLSDHGENLYERDYGMGHGEHFRGFYSTRIPLIFHYPKKFPRRMDIRETVRSVDIAPTLLELAGATVPEDMEGASLMPLIHGEADDDRIAYGETGIWFDNASTNRLFYQKLRIQYPDITALCTVDPDFSNQVVLRDEYRDLVNIAKHRMVFDGRYKLIYMPTREGVRYELYDTIADPDETRNRALADHATAGRLKKILFSWMNRHDDLRFKNELALPKKNSD